ncbi:MAG TPA: acyl-CoA dehydrogenase family protein [Acidimicrobiales bacterium]|jgi:alkylation response protein AidB-like acyl-CoA dehydrogenase|nr:acyl-CoA dehydrogenase family protein [Acidimicrobiales bacterium]
MDFTMTDEQVLLRDTARALLSKHCPPSLVRAHMDDPGAADPLWEHLQDWRVLGDGPMVDLCLFLEECGAVLAPGPFVATVLARQLSAAAVGDDTASVALAGRDGLWVPNVDTTKSFVLEADVVDAVLFVSSSGVEIARPAHVRQIGSVDSSRRLFEVGVSARRRVDHRDVEDWLERAYVALAAELVGTARWLLQASVEYAKQRVQFDVPIGSFQAIQHKLANMSLAVERAVSAVYYGAMAIDADDADRHRAAHVAKAAAGRAATTAAKDGIQIHGGIGYTWEHDLHLYIRRAYASEHLLGTSGWHHDRLADLILPSARDSHR